MQLKPIKLRDLLSFVSCDLYIVGQHPKDPDYARYLYEGDRYSVPEDYLDLFIVELDLISDDQLFVEIKLKEVI